MADRYNVVVIVGDDAPVDALDYMPYLTSKPSGHWIDFPNSVINYPQCAPSRATIFTGLYQQRHHLYNNNVADATLHAGLTPTQLLGPAMQKAGYHTAMIGKYMNGYPWSTLGYANTYRAPGWHEFRAFDDPPTYRNYTLVENGTRTAYGTSDAEYATDVIGTKATDFIAAAREPFFLYLAEWAPHFTNVPATRHASLYDGTTPERRPNFNEADISDKPQWLRDDYPTQRSQADIDTYDAEHLNAWRTLKAVDESIEDVIGALTSKGALDRTVVVWLTDNSDLYLEHRHFEKSVPYEEAIRAQMYVRYPGATQRSDPSLVSNIDIAPTLCALAGTTLPIAPDGMSMVPLLDGTIDSTQWRDAVVLERDQWAENPAYKYRFRGLRTAGWKYVEYGNGDRELYDLTNDPYELSNLAGQGAYAGTQSDLAGRLSVLYQG